MVSLETRYRQPGVRRAVMSLTSIAAALTLALVEPTPARAQSTTRVNVGPGGIQAQWGAGFPAISADGRFVSFTSHATNLVPDDTNASDDVFVHDRTTGATTRASVATGSAQALGHSGPNSALSRDGHIVAFSSDATNLVAGDTNGIADLFVHDLTTGTTTRVNVATGGAQANDWCVLYGISADGRFVAFSSRATNLVPGDTNAFDDGFVHDRATGETTRVSVASDGAQATGHTSVPATGWDAGGAISADGRFVAFSSNATNLVAGDMNGFGDVFVHDRLSGATTRVSVRSSGGEANHYSYVGELSDDGRIVVFVSAADNLAGGDRNTTWESSPTIG